MVHYSHQELRNVPSMNRSELYSHCGSSRVVSFLTEFGKLFINFRSIKKDLTSKSNEIANVSLTIQQFSQKIDHYDIVMSNMRFRRWLYGFWRREGTSKSCRMRRFFVIMPFRSWLLWQRSQTCSFDDSRHRVDSLPSSSDHAFFGFDVLSEPQTAR
jgi:hypothetical protein